MKDFKNIKKLKKLGVISFALIGGIFGSTSLAITSCNEKININRLQWTTKDIKRIATNSDNDIRGQILAQNHYINADFDIANKNNTGCDIVGKKNYTGTLHISYENLNVPLDYFFIETLLATQWLNNLEMNQH